MITFGLSAILLLLCCLGIGLGILLGTREEIPQSCGGVASNPECCMTCPEKDECDDAEMVLATHDEHPLLKQSTL